MNKTNRKYTLSSRLFCVGVSIGVGLGVLFASLSAFAQTTPAIPVTGFTGTTKEKVYGASSCDDTSAIDLTFTLIPDGGTFASNVTFNVFLGGQDAASGGIPLIANKSVAPTVSTTTGGTSSAVIAINSGIKIDKDRNSMFDDVDYLTIRDVVGYYKIAKKDPPITKPANPKEICALEEASDSDEITIQLCVSYKYSITPTTAGVDTNRENYNCENIKFDLSPPLAPEISDLSPSETQITVTWKTRTGYLYDVFYSKTPFTQATLSDATVKESISAASYKLTELEKSTGYYIAVRAVDKVGNKGSISEVKQSKTLELTDFYEAYRQAGGADKGFSGGGYCFIATAAYGTYDHSYVKVLRDFRDRFLLPNAPGKAFVSWYYANSPTWAAWIQRHPTAKRAVQVVLFPVIAAAAFFVRLSLLTQVLILLGLVLLVWGWRRKQRWMRWIPLALVFGAWMLPSVSWAQSPRNFGLEIRAGIFQPQIDKEVGLKQGQTPYKTIFGESVQFYTEIAGEWLVFKGFGSIGVGGSVGFTWAEGKALGGASTTTTTGTTNENKTGLWIIPLRLDVSYRFDYLVHRFGVPLVPYVRGGLDYYLWFITNPDGSVAKDTQTQDENAAFGGRFGFHVGLGLQFLLDIFDRRAAKTFDNEVGVNHTYLFFEWNFSWVGVLTPGLNLSDSSFRAGLLFQF